MNKEKKSERIQIVMSPSEVEALDDWSFSRRIRSRSEAIRQLITQGMHFSDIRRAELERESSRRK